jgi:soluble P-type ATPase
MDHLLYLTKRKTGVKEVGYVGVYRNGLIWHKSGTFTDHIVYNSNKMHKSQILFNLTTAQHVSDVTITHLQEHKTTVTTASGNRYTVLLSAAIVEELELI